MTRAHRRLHSPRAPSGLGEGSSRSVRWGRARRRLAGWCVVVFLSGCPRNLTGPGDEGLASWYGQELRGRPTASGEPFDPNGLTAAHRTLPFGSCVRVERVGTERSVEVRVNDRGPFIRGRIIDLSARAARELGISGVSLVRLAPCR